VINFDCPHFTADYIHRAGRTGRVGSHNQCLVSTFVCFKPDAFMVQKLELALRLNKEIEHVNGNIQKELELHKQENIERKRQKHMK
jgi:ATP-dependent RNA helicase DDX28